jgi:hypothetical protein
MGRKHRRREFSLSSTADDATAQSTASSPAPDRQPQTKKEKFKDRYKTEETSDADVLGECQHMETICNPSIHIGFVAMQMKTWTSEVYEHFKSPTIEQKGGEVRYAFVCKKYDIFACRLSVRSHLHYRNPSVVVTRVRHDESTSNLVHHADRCAPGAATLTTSISAFAHGSTYSYPKFRMKLALWVV